MSFDSLRVLRRPIVTERSTMLKSLRKYVFEVDTTATKGQIREAVERTFNVNVTAVNTAHYPGKARRRMSPQGGYSSDWKKAVVTIKGGQEIKFAEPRP